MLARVLLSLSLACSMSAAAQGITVFAAASLTNAFEEIGSLYRAKRGASVRFSFAASSTLAKQIDAGAAANLFVSADEQWMDWATRRKLVLAGTRRALLGNALVLVTPLDRAIAIDIANGFDLARVLGPNGRLATGDPAHVPVGRYGQEALTKLGVWPLAESRLVRSESVRAALALVERGEASAGIVYATDAVVSRRVRVVSTFPVGSHSPVIYPVASVAGHDTPATRRFYEFLFSEDAAALYRKHGFTVK